MVLGIGWCLANNACSIEFIIQKITDWSVPCDYGNVLQFWAFGLFLLQSSNKTLNETVNLSFSSFLQAFAVVLGMNKP